MATKKTEQGIREYLDSLGADTKPIVDKELVKSLKAEVRGTSDPIAKLRLLAALEDAEAGSVPDTSGLEAVFVAEAKAWADGEGIPASAFVALGVPESVLKQAGFEVASVKGSAPKAAGGRAKRLSIEEVEEAVMRLENGGWPLKRLAREIDRDPGTTRNYINKMLERGFIKEIGDDPNHDGRGRAPKLYERT